VKGLLDFARQSTSEKRRTHLKEIIHHAASILQNQLALHNIRIVLNLQEEIPPVQADINQLQQVLVNLFVNAGDAMAETGGTITVDTALVHPEPPPVASSAAPEVYVQITVQDTGCGIPAENLDKIFDPFFTTKGQQGTGLGLAIVWGIIQEHNGRITVESSVGEGTTFTILLPAAGT
jgi:two-component system NtrC family sensor kinase